MLKVYEKAPFPIKAVVSAGVYELIIPFMSAADADLKEREKV
jgi:hypothetical protein